LTDAFKRLKSIKASDQVISTKPVVLLVISFGGYGLAQILLLTQMFKSIRHTYYYFVEFDHITFIAACITLTIVLQELILRQH